MKLFKPFGVLLLFTSLIFVSCSEDSNEILKDPTTPTAYQLIVNPTNAANQAERNITIEAQPNSKVDVKVTFTGKDNMFRLYTAKNEFGVDEGFVPYEYTTGNKKADGSLNLDASDKEKFTYNLSFDAPTSADGVVAYTLWATTGRGDFRNVNKRNAVGDNAIGTITIKGNPNANAEANGLKSFSAVLLAAPLKDGSSKTFISLFDEEVYAINQGEEYAALWDFGYFYGNTNKASLASTANYPSDIVDIKTIAKVTQEDLNNFYFVASNKTAAEFDAISAKSDLDYITKPSSERVTKLNVDDVVEFVDAYGNKGLIKITEINGTDGTTGNIKFDVKVQVNAQPIKL